MNRPAAPLLLLLCAATSLVPSGCGSSSPAGPGPGPSPSPSGPPGPVAGAYVLQIVPAAACGLPSTPLLFAMTAAAAPTPQHQGLQVVLTAAPPHLEAEFLAAGTSVRGGFGSIGVLAQSDVRVWLRSVAEGTVTRARDGRGEIVGGVMNGYLALGGPIDVEGALGSCTNAHSFSLRAQ